MKNASRKAVGLLATVWAVMLSAIALMGQETSRPGREQPPAPKITPIPGGYYVEFARMTDVEGFELKKPVMTGKYEVTFDVKMNEIGLQPKKPESPELLEVLANYWIVRSKPENAISIYERGLTFSPTSFKFQNNLALLLSNVRGEHGKALEILDGALERQNDNVNLLDSKGLVLMNADRPDEAVPILERAVTLSCQGPLYMMHLAQALDMGGRETSARNWFDKARPSLDGTTRKLAKEDKEMLDNLKMKYSTPNP